MKISQRTYCELLGACLDTGGRAELVDAGEVLGGCPGALDVDFPLSGHGTGEAVWAMGVVE